MIQQLLYNLIKNKTKDKLYKNQNFLIEKVNSFVSDKNPYKQYMLLIVENPFILLSIILFFGYFFTEQICMIMNAFLLLQSLFLALTSFNSKDSKKTTKKLAINVLCISLLQIKFLGSFTTLFLSYLLLNINTNSFLFDIITQYSNTMLHKMIPSTIISYILPDDNHKEKKSKKNKDYRRK